MKYMYWIFISVGATPLNDALNASSLAEGWFGIILELCLWKAIIVQYILYMLKSGNCLSDHIFLENTLNATSSVPGWHLVNSLAPLYICYFL